MRGPKISTKKMRFRLRFGHSARPIVAKYCLSQLPKEDLAGIAQSDRYRNQQSVCGVHSIYYRIDEQNVEIRHVLGRQDSERRLWGGKYE
ncbi:MAG: hypothetical protein NPIRA02_32480 [Nitrospirales bacterium]|nr:MAG: hypothetical protein NPIRA02_32480 [Nitrospirales bacterium]